MSTTDIKEIDEAQRFEKATLKLHCVLCGDSMFAMDIGRYACIECNIRQEIIIQFNTHNYESAEDGGLQSFDGEKILPEEVHIKIEKISVDVNLLKEFIGFIERFE